VSPPETKRRPARGGADQLGSDRSQPPYQPIVVEHNVPMPKFVRRAAQRSYPWAQLREVGDSFHVEADAPGGRPEIMRVVAGVSRAASSRGLRLGCRYIVRRTECGARCWLYSPPE
jgi:hypothetical protein